jgi:hypothetical protein
MADSLLYEKAASCYYQAQLFPDAIRCYRLAGAYRHAADLNLSRGAYREAAADLECAGLPEYAGWVLAHLAGDPMAARAAVTRFSLVPDPERAPRDGTGASPPPDNPLRHQLVLARCKIADGAPPASILPVIQDVCAELADRDGNYDRLAEEWAIALAEHVRRYDQVALVFAASVRGRRHGAEQRWAQWAAHIMGMEVTIPVPPGPGLPVAGG